MNNNLANEAALLAVISKVKRTTEAALALNPDTNLLDDIGFDSLEITELIFFVEEELQVGFNYERFEEKHLLSFKEFCNFVTQECMPSNGG